MYMMSSSRGPKTPFGGGSGVSARGFFVRADMSSVTGEFRVLFHAMVAVDVQALGRLEETGAFVGSSAVFAACLEGEDRVMAAIKFNLSVIQGNLEELKNRDTFIRLRRPSFESRWPQGINMYLGTRRSVSGSRPAGTTRYGVTTPS
jgi:hypothetical protein